MTDEAELADVAEQRNDDIRHAEPEAHADAAETAVPDIREVAADEPVREQDDDIRVPSAGETAESVEQAQRALAEMRARQELEARQAEYQARAERIERWRTVEAQEVDVAYEAERSPALEMAAIDD
ncbi:hypothetical protein [Haloechinothrix halophila]|uniref:hypothetical protein n=1 Tax=Haloechinothrix halophila TaxID=1069073 RepID=UPI00041ADC5C|nr:hypothetical protein [Haloechinothrix halophila]